MTCHNRFTVQVHASVFFIGYVGMWTWKWGYITFPKTLNVKSIYKWINPFGFQQGVQIQYQMKNITILQVQMETSLNHILSSNTENLHIIGYGK